MIEVFQQVGSDIESAWRDRDYSEEAFPSIASEALRSADIPSKVSAWEILEWTLRQPELPLQRDPNAIFGDPPLTLYNGPRFYIDVYFWVDGTTEIHQHSFCGAFQVLLGSSIHSWYDFEREEAVNAFTEIGRMDLKLCQLLEAGDIQEIVAGREYVHSLFHLDQPSVTIVVRTERSPRHFPQFSYHKPSLALDPFFEHQTTTRKLQSITLLFKVERPETDSVITELLETSDFQTTVALLSHLHRLIKGNGLNQVFNLDGTSSRLQNFVDVATRRHGEKTKSLWAVFEHRDRLNEIVRRRSYVTNAEHRFFLALLLNVDGRERIFDLIRQRFPGADPISKILDWSYELAQTRVVGANISNALGIEGFDDLDLSVVEHLLYGKSMEEVRDLITNEYGADRIAAADMDGRLARINQSVIFAPLFSK